MKAKILNDLDENGNMLDSILYEIVTPETGILIGERYYLRDTVLGIVMSNSSKDPYDNDKNLDYLIEHKNQNILNGITKRNNDMEIFSFICFIFFLIIIIIL